MHSRAEPIKPGVSLTTFFFHIFFFINHRFGHSQNLFGPLNLLPLIYIFDHVKGYPRYLALEQPSHTHTHIYIDSLFM